MEARLYLQQFLPDVGRQVLAQMAFIVGSPKNGLYYSFNAQKSRTTTSF